LKEVRIKQVVDSNWYEGEYDDSTDEGGLTAINLFGENKNSKD